MSTPPRINTDDHHDKHFSRLEASFAKIKVLPRQNSIEMKDVWKHAPDSKDMVVNELDFDSTLTTDDYPLARLESLHEVFPAFLNKSHLSNGLNFADNTDIRCFDLSENGAEWLALDEGELAKLLKTVRAPDVPWAKQPNTGRILIFLAPLTPVKNTSYGSQVSMTRNSVSAMIEALHVNPTFLLNMVGRPDYWAPQTRWETDENGQLQACDFFCQHPRWNLEFQGAPLSVYMRHHVPSKLTTYIITHKHQDSSIWALQNIINIATKVTPQPRQHHLFLNDPFDIAVILSSLSFETSKHHVKRFQRYMWTQINKVDDHLAGLETNDRSQLGELTKSLQIISQQADSHLLNADVAILTAKGIQDAHSKFQRSLSSLAPVSHFQRAADSIGYIISSMEKQKNLFLNYKNRKDGTMALVYNLVTQEDAGNNIQLAASMKRDSTSMNGIAGLTMVFLPGTFTASVLSADVLSVIPNSQKFSVSAMLWLWVAITAPLTVIVLGCWWAYKWREERGKKKRPKDSVDLEKG